LGRLTHKTKEMNRKEYNKCVDAHADGLYRFMLKNIGRTDDAQDIVQDVFLKLWEKVDTVDFEKAKSYLFTAAFRTMLDRIKKKKPVSSETVSFVEPHHSGQYNDVKEILDREVALLPDKQKAAITLRDYEGYSYQEIGEILDMNESQVKVTIFRARKTLKNKIGSAEVLI
jgi:RNA polymerase sigma factor (sigma-70 family)